MRGEYQVINNSNKQGGGLSIRGLVVTREAEYQVVGGGRIKKKMILSWYGPLRFILILLIEY